MKLTLATLILFLTCLSLQATPIITPDSIPLDPSDPGIGRPIIGIPGSTWDVWANDNWRNTAPGVNGDFDFNDGHGIIQFLTSGEATWLGSTAGHTNEFVIAGQHINAVTPGPVTFTYTPNAELIIQFRDLTAGHTYWSGPASRNCDGAPHIWTEQIQETPEPATLAMVGFGVLALGMLRRKQKA
jgi:hypothetical protein